MSERGFVRKKNEDNFLFDEIYLQPEHAGTEGILRLNTDERMILGLFDGMGGEAGGEYASFLAAGVFSKLKEEENIDAEILKKYYQEANDAVFDYAYEHIGRFSGTTANLLIFYEDSLVYGNIGDSRTYLYRGGELKQISVDHTDIKMMELYGVVNRKPELTQCLGLDSEEIQIEPSIGSLQLKNGDVLLLCSDGVTDTVDLKEVPDLFENDVDVIASEIVEKALMNGGVDNTTIIAVRYLD